MKVKHFILALMTSSMLLQGCALTRPPLPDPEPITNTVDLRTDWRRGVDGGFGEATERFNIIVEQNSLYFITKKGVVYQLDQDTGKRMNAMKTEADVSAGIAKNDQTLYFGTYDAQLQAISLNTNTVLWSKLLTSEVLAEPAYAANKLAVQTGDGWLAVLDASNGDTLWRIKEDLPSLTVRGTSAPIIVDGKVVAGFATGKVKAFGLLSGKEIWSFDVGKPEGRYEIERLADVDGRLLVQGDVVYATAYNGTVSAIALSTGRPLWQRSIPSAHGVALKDDVLVVVDQDSHVFALNAKNGSQLWEHTSLLDRDLAAPAFMGDYIALMDRAGYVHLLEHSQGRLVARKLADQALPAGSRMVSKGKQLFILTRNEQVTALTY